MAQEFARLRAVPGIKTRGDDLLQRAIAALSRQHPEEAERIAGEILKREPSHAQALHIFAHALLMQRRCHEVIAVLEPAARSHHDPQLQTQLAIALRQAGRPEEALSWLQRAAKRRPPYVPALFELGCLLSSMKRYDKAAEALSRCVEIAPMMPEPAIQLGHVFLALRRCASAKAAFFKALESSQASALGALWGMGKAHQMLGEHRAAIEYFRRYLTTMPNDMGVWLNLGHCLIEVGELDEGYECFRKAARADQKGYSAALTTFVKSARGRFWLRPSASKRFLNGQNG